jgi:SPP1 family predicted phage head-tail adaptor
MKTILQANSPVLQVGKMRHRIQVVRTNQVQDQAGGVSLADIFLVHQCFASIESTGGAENFAASQLISATTYEVVIRYFDGITSDMLVLWDARRFNITNVSDPDGRRKFLVLTCTEINDSK